MSAPTRIAALAYAGQGFAVFPCGVRSKDPVVARGFYSATCNPQTIQRLWRQADRNVAIRTGMASALWVLDIDGHAGEASMQAIEAQHGALPPTRQVVTGKGHHLWFICDSPIPCSASRVGPNIDVRGDSGYIIAPPSVHPSGHVYTFVDPTIAIATAPGWLVDLAQKRKISERAVASMRSSRPSQLPGVYGQAALDREADALANVPPGARNDSLNLAAFRLFQLVAGGELDRDQVAERLIDACHRNGLVRDDGLQSVHKTVRSGYRAGMQHPRSRGAA
jgi:putative DNA primase/helicase